MAKKVTEELCNEAFIHASNYFLTEQVPDNWFDMEPDEQDAFIDEHRWEPLEHVDTDDIIEIIDNAARFLVKYMVSKGFYEE